MQFVANGPDIPDTLLQAHEEGRVVFFCGAGISYPAGLPGFKGLVDEIYRQVGTNLNRNELEAYNRNQFDATLDLLERRLPGQRLRVRTALVDTLKPNLRLKGATDTHSALLQLARCRKGALRLVTTNFDRIFEKVAKRTKQSTIPHSAPMLPIPKNSRWNGLVYLHGLLPEHSDESALNRLVLTSGDFGLAYLTERWAARFVSELFRNYVVCFVGYSINDPVLRYMMDALAADRMLGEITPQAFALGDCMPGQEDTKTVEWESKGVYPILYEVPTGTHNHSALHQTLKAWAETYRDGILGKERIVVDYAITHPAGSTRQDNFVGRMLWALTHESGIPAKNFADFNPVPPLDWLEAFSDDRYRHSDLERFGIPARSEVNDKLRFSLLSRPAPYTCAPWMELVSGGTVGSQHDSVMFQLGRWLVRHLNDPTLILWIVQHGGQLHERWAWLIEDKLNFFTKLEQEGNIAGLDEIRANAPNAIPQPPMRVMWRLFLTGRVKLPRTDLDLYGWKDRLKRDGLVTTLRLELREFLAPKVAIKKPFRWNDEEEEANSPERLKQLVDWELVLATEYVHSSIKDLADTNQWREALPHLFEDFQQLLRDALDLLCELGEGDNHSDRSQWDLPSISPHWQNRFFRDWVALIELLRDSWLAIRETEPERAARLAQSWFIAPYPTFKRLALFAASQPDCIPADQWINWLLSDSSWWLWSINTKRETMRLLVLQGAQLKPIARERLEAAILAGPPRSMYPDDIESEYWQSIVDHGVWGHLAKLQESGGGLGDAALEKFNELSAKYPQWKLSSNERDEFSHWMSGTGDPDYESSRQVDLAPRKRSELVDWLKQGHPSSGPFYEDTWRETCRTRFFHSAFALHDLAREGVWPKKRWNDALHAWSEEDRVKRSWRFAAPLVQTMPTEVLQENATGVSWWLKAISKSLDRHEKIFLNLCQRILDVPLQNDLDSDEPVTKAINHPVGHVTEALLNIWFSKEPNDNDKLPNNLEPLFTQLCDKNKSQFPHGRVLLASRLIALFRVDRTWTENHLLPLFDWNIDMAEAKAAWAGFLWSPRLYPPLLIAFKEQFLDTVNHYTQLGENGQQFAAFLTFAALELVETYKKEEFQTAISKLEKEGLEESARALARSLEGSGDQREEYWRNRVLPFWRHIWPKAIELTTNSIADSLARMSIAARGEFPSALAEVVDWLHPIEHPGYVIRNLQKSGLSSRFPEDALTFLNAIIKDQLWISKELGQCLKEISETLPSLCDDYRYIRLTEYARQQEI